MDEASSIWGSITCNLRSPEWHHIAMVILQRGEMMLREDYYMGQRCMIDQCQSVLASLWQTKSLHWGVAQGFSDLNILKNHLQMWRNADFDSVEPK